MNSLKEIETMTVKEFMEWFTSEYDGHWLPSDFDRVIDKLDGYRIGLRDSEEVGIVSSAVTLLRESRNLLDMLKISGWKYK